MGTEEFPAVEYADWRELVSRAIDGDPEDLLATEIEPGITILPLYTREQTSGRPLRPREKRNPGAVPSLCPQLPIAGPVETSVHILEDLRGGATAVRLDLDSAARSGLDAASPAGLDLTARDGLPIHRLADLERCLDGVQLDAVGLAVTAGANTLPAAALVFALIHQDASLPPRRLDFAADPLGALARDGHLPRGLGAARTELTALVEICLGHPQTRAVEVSGLPYFEAGADASEELGFALATTLEYLRWMVSTETDVAGGFDQIVWALAAEHDVFLGMAKLRAARLLWDRAIAAFGAEGAPALALRSVSGLRRTSLRSPPTNLLRATAETFAALTGGADEIAPAPFDRLIGSPSSLARRLARNVPLTLAEESGLLEVRDAAAGSYYLETLTEALARKAWDVMREMELLGGMPAALGLEAPHRRIERSKRRRLDQLSNGERQIVGVTSFQESESSDISASPIDPEPLARDTARRLRTGGDGNYPLTVGEPTLEWLDRAVDAAAAGASIGQLSRSLAGSSATRITPLLPFHEASELEMER